MASSYDKITNILNDLRPGKSEFFSWADAKSQFFVGYKQTFSNGVIIECIEIGVNKYGQEYITLEVFMPAGTCFSRNHHDFLEILVPVRGLGEDRITPYVFQPCKPQRIPINRVHSIDAITDFYFLSHLVNKDFL